MSTAKAIYAVPVLLALAASGYYYLRIADENQDKSPSSTAVPPLSHATRETPVSEPTGGPAAVRSTDAGQPPGNHSESGFYVAKDCYNALFSIRQLQAGADCQNLASRPGAESAYAECLKRWDDEQTHITRFQRAIANSHCADEHDVLSAYYNSTKQAARQGNTDAQLCYLQSHFLGFDEKGHYTEQDIADYRASSPLYIEKAFHSDDWRIVQLLSTDNHGGLSGLSLYIPDIGMPETIYKMTKLLRLGATGDYAKELDVQLNDRARPDGKENPYLPQSKIDEGNAWAEKTYAQYFSGAPHLDKTPYPCPMGTPES
jgi:hypothetical protein